MRKLAFIALAAFLTVSFATLAHADMTLTKPADSVVVKNLADLVGPDVLKISKSGEYGVCTLENWKYQFYTFRGEIPGVYFFETHVHYYGRQEEGVRQLVFWETDIVCEDLEAKSKGHYSYPEAIRIEFRLSRDYAATREKLTPYLKPNTVEGELYMNTIFRGKTEIMIFPLH